jgi:hypothetical protein
MTEAITPLLSEFRSLAYLDLEDLALLVVGF